MKINNLIESVHMKYPVGTQYIDNNGRLCAIVDFLVTKNLAGNVVQTRYVSTHEFMGQTITDRDVVDVTIAKGIARMNDPVFMKKINKKNGKKS